MSTAKFKNITTYAAVIGRTLAILREQKGYDQQTFAAKVGISRATWSRIENGNSSLSVEDLVRAAKVLGIDPGAIVHRAEEARGRLRAGGVVVHDKTSDVGIDKTWLVLGAAALAAVILGVKGK